MGRIEIYIVHIQTKGGIGKGKPIYTGFLGKD